MRKAEAADREANSVMFSRETFLPAPLSRNSNSVHHPSYANLRTRYNVLGTTPRKSHRSLCDAAFNQSHILTCHRVGTMTDRGETGIFTCEAIERLIFAIEVSGELNSIVRLKWHLVVIGFGILMTGYFGLVWYQSYLGPSVTIGQTEFALDYPQALASAKRQNKPVLIFVRRGVEDANDLKIHREVMLTPVVQRHLQKFVCVSAAVDPEFASIATRMDWLNTADAQRIVDQNRQFQIDFLQDVTVPTFVVVSSDFNLDDIERRTVFGEPFYYTHEEEKFADFLVATWQEWHDKRMR